MIHYMTSDGVGQPWVGNELRQVERGGVPFKLHAMRAPTSVHFTSAWVHDLNQKTNVLYPVQILPMASSFLFGPFIFGGRFWGALANALFGERESLRGRVAALAHFFVANHWARLQRNADVSHVHSQWAYSSGTIGMYGAWLLDKSFSFTGHAADLFRDRVALKDKIRRADFIICISEFHRDFYLQQGARPEQLLIAYCGIDPKLFTLKQRERKDDEPYRILSSGRLVEKKGFSDLITACGILRDRGFEFECVIAGSGPLEDQLRHEVKALELEDSLTITGQPLKQEHIPEFMHGGDVYCLPCVWASDNDVDGLPQMLMEGMACGCPAISTKIVGIPDLVIHGETGLLVDPHAPEQIADAVMMMAEQPELANRSRIAGRKIIEEKFNLTSSLEPLIRQYKRKLGTQTDSTKGGDQTNSTDHAEDRPSSCAV